MEPLPDGAKNLLDSPTFATIATIEPDGRPQLSVVWVKSDGDDVLVSTTTNRRKYANMVRDPRASISAFDKDKPYSYVEVRGTVSLTEQGGRELIDELAAKYMGADRYSLDDGTDNVRVVVRITPEKVVFAA